MRRRRIIRPITSDTTADMSREASWQLKVRASARSPRARRSLVGVLGCVLAACALLMAGSGCKLAARGQNVDGVRQFQQGAYQGALERFQQALYNDPQSADALYNLAATYHRLGNLEGQKSDWEQAENYYNQCLDHDEEHGSCYRGLAVLLVEQGRSEEAFRLLEGWVDRSPSLSAARIELARLFEEYGDRQAAKQHLLEAIAVDPYNSRALAALGKLHEDLGNPEQAFAVYQRALWHDRFQPEVAARVAALQTALAPSAASGGTRTVISHAPTQR